VCKHFRDGNAKNVPHAAKDKKELIKNLQKRGYKGKTIEKYLSLSSLADS